jgi:hypothetical protein
VLVLGVFVLVLVQSVRGVAAGGHPGPLLRCHSTDPSDAALQLLHLLALEKLYEFETNTKLSRENVELTTPVCHPRRSTN